MDDFADEPPSSFIDHVYRLMERVEHRTAIAREDREAVYRLRFDAYVRSGLIIPAHDDQLFDAKYDTAPNTWLTTTFVDGQLAGTTRVTFGSDVSSALPTMQVYSDIVLPYLRAGRRIVDFTRLAANLELSRKYAQLAYLIVRPGYLALRHFDVDFGIASPRAEHVAFYRRVFQFQNWAAPREYPGVTVKCPCVGMDFKAACDAIERRYPFYSSTRSEREALFGPTPVPASLTGTRELRPETPRARAQARS